MNADRLNEIREARAMAHRAVTEGVNVKYIDLLRKQTYAMCDLADSLSAALDAAEQRAKAAQDRLDEVVKDHDLYWRDRAAQAEQERDEALRTIAGWEIVGRDRERLQARLAETQKALEREWKLARDRYRDLGTAYDEGRMDLAGELLDASAALTTHHTDEA